MGPMMVFIGLFGGGLLWLILCGARFDFLIHNVYHGDPGEAIWGLDPIFTLLAAIPGITLALIGLILSLVPRIADRAIMNQEQIVTHRMSNLFYLGEISILFTTIVSLIGFFGTFSIIIEITTGSGYLMFIVAMTGGLHLASTYHSTIKRQSHDTRIHLLPKATAIFLGVELLILTALVFLFHWYIWSFIRHTTALVVLSGYLGIFLISFNLTRRRE